jgi:membrane protease YdiL (CAAX protease family)
MSKTELARLKKGLKKLRHWLMWNAMFSVLPFSIVMLLNFFSLSDYIDRKTANETRNILKGGTFALFSVALMGSIVADILIAKKFEKIKSWYNKPNWFLRFVLIQVPFLALITVTTVYLYIVYGEGYEEVYLQYALIPKVITWYGFVYCIIVKLITFIREKES